MGPDIEQYGGYCLKYIQVCVCARTCADLSEASALTVPQILKNTMAAEHSKPVKSRPWSLQRSLSPPQLDFRLRNQRTIAGAMVDWLAADHPREKTKQRSVQAPERSGPARVEAKLGFLVRHNQQSRALPCRRLCAAVSQPRVRALTHAQAVADGEATHPFKVGKLLQMMPASSNEQLVQMVTSFYTCALTVNQSPSGSSHSYIRRAAFGTWGDSYACVCVCVWWPWGELCRSCLHTTSVSHPYRSFWRVHGWEHHGPGGDWGGDGSNPASARGSGAARIRAALHVSGQTACFLLRPSKRRDSKS